MVTKKNGHINPLILSCSMTLLILPSKGGVYFPTPSPRASLCLALAEVLLHDFWTKIKETWHLPFLPLGSQLPCKKAPAGQLDDDRPLERENLHGGQLRCPSRQPGPRPQICERGHGRYSAPAEPPHLNASLQSHGQFNGFKALSSGVVCDAAIEI